MRDDVAQLSDSVGEFGTKVDDTSQYLKKDILGVLNCVAETIREEVAKMRDDLLKQIKDIRTEVESVKADVMLCKAAVARGVTREGPRSEVKKSSKHKGKQVEEGDQYGEGVRQKRANHVAHGKDLAQSNGDGRNGGKSFKPMKYFICEGSHMAKACPHRQILSVIKATTGEESLAEGRQWAIHLGEEAQVANVRLLNDGVQDGPYKEAPSTIMGVVDRRPREKALGFVPSLGKPDSSKHRGLESGARCVTRPRD
ncbi:hypothetical protein SOVF_021540 [Spinacia oleracea]|nr:hypothetical protein SOVF_021540 [Spinacia oleracea]